MGYRSLSDQPLLCLDEGVGLRNGDLEQISDSLRGCQGEPMRVPGQSVVQD